MRSEAVEQYGRALKLGQKYYKAALLKGHYPYPLVLDDILRESSVAGYSDLGVINIPSSLVIGVRSAGRIAALAGNFMPLLAAGTEFSSKWISLCEAHLSESGIRDPIECYEYLGRFYILEGNKRFSVLRSFDSPSVSAHVTRVIPIWSEDHEIQVYYEFMHFYSLSGQYGLSFRHRGQYAKLQAALGFEPEYVWSSAERRSFSSGFYHFCNALEKFHPAEHDILPGDALLLWLEFFPFSEIKNLTLPELTKRLENFWPDMLTRSGSAPIEVSTEPQEKEPGVLSRLAVLSRRTPLSIAFLYGWPPEYNLWTRAHDEGRRYLEEQLGDRVSVKVYRSDERNYTEILESAIEDGAELVFATTAHMMEACRKAAALHSSVKIMNCALFLPYTGVRMYNGRTYECKFITGALAGAMSDGNTLGYVANAPIYGTPASVNAFALGARLTNPDARIKLDWACLPGDPVQRLRDAGVRVISNREITSPDTVDTHFELGTFRFGQDGSLQPMAAPFWNWGELYKKIVLSVFSGAWDSIASDRAISYWWGIASGVLDIRLSDTLPEGMRRLGAILKNGICSGAIAPFRAEIRDQEHQLRNDGTRDFTPEEIISMNWFCDNVDGDLPSFGGLLPEYTDTTRVLGLYRRSLLPETEGGGQL